MCIKLFELVFLAALASPWVLYGLPIANTLCESRAHSGIGTCLKCQLPAKNRDTDLNVSFAGLHQLHVVSRLNMTPLHWAFFATNNKFSKTFCFERTAVLSQRLFFKASPIKEKCTSYNIHACMRTLKFQEVHMFVFPSRIYIYIYPEACANFLQDFFLHRPKFNLLLKSLPA